MRCFRIYSNQVLYFNYLSPYEYGSNEEVTQALVDAGHPMCRKTMTEYRSLAVDCVSSILWGFSARDCREILDRLCRNEQETGNPPV